MNKCILTSNLYEFYHKNDTDKNDLIWKCKSPNSDIAWKMFALRKNLTIEHVQMLFCLK